MKKEKLGIHGVLVTLAAIVVWSSIPVASQSRQPKNVQMTNVAWEAFNKRDYKTAIEKADECLSEFQAAANRQEEALERQHAPLPPTGKVSERQKNLIFANGLVNDVATCFYIKGRSFEFLGDMPKARDAYKATMNYRYARTWDPQGWFWSPLETASDRLKRLESK